MQLCMHDTVIASRLQLSLHEQLITTSLKLQDYIYELEIIQVKGSNLRYFQRVVCLL